MKKKSIQFQALDPSDFQTVCRHGKGPGCRTCAGYIFKPNKFFQIGREANWSSYLREDSVEKISRAERLANYIKYKRT